jgi:glycosyltransferase 2 family protein
MKKIIIRILQYGLPLVLAVLLLRWLLREVSFEQLAGIFRQADYRWFLLSSGLALAAHLSRGYRWTLLLKPLGYPAGTGNAFMAVMIGYFANFALPRIGEITRCGVLKSTDNVPMEAGIGTVVAERVIDLVMLLVFCLLTFLLEFEKVQGLFTQLLHDKIADFQNADSRSYLVFMASLLLITVILAYLFYRFRQAILQNKLVVKIKDFISGIWSGVMSVGKLEKPGAFVFHTLFIWTMYYFSTYTLLFALPQTAQLGWRAGFTVFVLGTFGMAAPVQGGVGAFHGLVSQTLQFYGLGQNDSILLAFFMHASQMILLIVAGSVCSLVYLWILYRKRKDQPVIAKI